MTTLPAGCASRREMPPNPGICVVRTGAGPFTSPDFHTTLREPLRIEGSTTFVPGGRSAIGRSTPPSTPRRDRLFQPDFVEGAVDMRGRISCSPVMNPRDVPGVLPPRDSVEASGPSESAPVGPQRTGMHVPDDRNACGWKKTAPSCPASTLDGECTFHAPRRTAGNDRSGNRWNRRRTETNVSKSLSTAVKPARSRSAVTTTAWRGACA